MGSRFSSFLVMCNIESSSSSPVMGSPETCLGDLPESVVGNVLVHLTPQEICRLAGLNRAFRGASSADFVWESKLPENYISIISKVKKDIYAKLSRPYSIDGDTKANRIDSTVAAEHVFAVGLILMGMDQMVPGQARVNTGQQENGLRVNLGTFVCERSWSRYLPSSMECDCLCDAKEKEYVGTFNTC